MMLQQIASNNLEVLGASRTSLLLLNFGSLSLSILLLLDCFSLYGCIFSPQHMLWPINQS